jgi:ABC-2 type transport system permease protein
VTSPVNPYADNPAGPMAPTAGLHSPDAPGADAGPTKPVFSALCGLMARTQITRVRVGAVLLLSALSIASGVAYGNGVRIGVVKQPLVSGAQWIDELGLAFVVPVATLLFASSMFGDLTEDKTLVYMWLRPVSRARITLAAALTSYVATWPLVVPALAATAACTGGGQALVLATIFSASIAIAGYTGVFVALGARVRVPLVWGLLYIMIWEKYVSSAGAIAQALSLRTYATSVLEALTVRFAGISTSGVTLNLAWLPLVPAVVVPLGVSALALVYATRRLARQEVA